MYRVRLARHADTMLLSHTKFLANVSPPAARKLVSDFKKAKNKLAKDPNQFPFADEFDALGIPQKTYRKCIFYGRYKALFLIENDNVYIDAIIDCRQENKNIFAAHQ